MQVGTRVRIVEDSEAQAAGHESDFLGLEGTITKVYPPSSISGFGYDVTFDQPIKDLGQTFGFSTSEMQAV